MNEQKQEIYWYFGYGRVYHILSGEFHHIKSTNNDYPIMLCGIKSWHRDLYEHEVIEAPTWMPLCKRCKKAREVTK